MGLSLLKRRHDKLNYEIKIINPGEVNDKKDFLENNKRILTVLLTRSEIQINIIQGYENNITQSRNFYSIIIVGLFYFMITKISVGIIFLTMFVIIILYLLEIHLKDLVDIQDYAKSITNKNIDYLMDNFEDKLYHISYTNFHEYVDKLAGFNRFKRKLIKAFRPDFSLI